MALIEETCSHRIHYVGVGGQLGDVQIKKIELNQASLSEQEQAVVLRNNAFQLLSLGKRESNSSRGEESTASANSRWSGKTDRNQNESTGQEGIQEMRQRFQNASPEEKEQMRQ